MSSIRWQLGSRLLGGVLLVSVGSGALLYGYVRKSLTAQLDASLAEKAQELGRLVHQDAQGRLVLEEDDLPPGRAGPATDHFEVWTEDGTMVARSRSLEGQGLPRSAARTREFSILELARRRLAGLHPHADEWEIGWRLVTLLYGEALGAELRQVLTSRA